MYKWRESVSRVSNFAKFIITAAVSGSILLSGCGAGSGSMQSSGMTSLSAGDYQSAAASFQQGIDAHEDREACWRGLGIAYMGLGQYKEAAAAFEKALDYAGAIPTDMEYDINSYLGSCYYKLGQYQKALDVYNAVLDLHPQDADAYVLRGATRIALGDQAGMTEDFEKAISLQPTDYDRLITIYEVMTRNNLGDDGKTYLQNAIDQHGKDMSDYDLGRLSYYLEDYKSARDYLVKIQDNADDKTTILLGQTYEKLGDYNYAASVYQAYIDRDSKNAAMYNQLGLCDMEMGSYDDALTAFEAGIALGDGDMTQTLTFNEITCYEYLGDFEKAKVMMSDYLGKYPGDAAAKRENQFLQTR